MSDHVKRGAERYENRPETYDPTDDDSINAVWCCTECDEPLEIRSRTESHHAYVSVGCPCGAESVDLRVADLFDFQMKSWDSVVAHELDREL